MVLQSEDAALGDGSGLHVASISNTGTGQDTVGERAVDSLSRVHGRGCVECEDCVVDVRVSKL